jgi:predicted ester cyclase
MSDRAVLDRYVDELWNGHRTELIDELVTEDFVRHGPPSLGGDVVGREAFRTELTQLFADSPDLTQHIEARDDRGDTTVIRITTTATHVKSVAGEEPTGNLISIPCLWLIRAENGRVAEEWVAMDTLSLAQQIGMVPAPA